MPCENCNHSNLKRIFSHGRKSAPKIWCKDCDKIITKKDIKRNNFRFQKVKN